MPRFILIDRQSGSPHGPIEETTMENNLFISESDGGLYDTREPGWSLLRLDYQRTFAVIETVSQLKATLRNGSHACGYPLYFITIDGDPIAFETARAEFRNLVSAMWNGDRDWRVVGCEVNWEDGDLFDAHTGDQIEAAYV